MNSLSKSLFRNILLSFLIALAINTTDINKTLARTSAPSCPPLTTVQPGPEILCNMPSEVSIRIERDYTIHWRDGTEEERTRVGTGACGQHLKCTECGNPTGRQDCKPYFYGSQNSSVPESNGCHKSQWCQTVVNKVAQTATIACHATCTIPQTTCLDGTVDTDKRSRSSQCCGQL